MMTNLLKSPKTVTNHLARLIKLAHADGEFHEKEKSLIMKIGKEHGLPDSKINSLILHPPIFDDVVPTSLEDRLTQLIDYVKLMAIDYHISEAEITLYYSLAQQLGFRKIILNLLLDCVDIGLQKGLSYNEIQKECEIFLID